MRYVVYILTYGSMYSGPGSWSSFELEADSTRCSAVTIHKTVLLIIIIFSNLHRQARQHGLHGGSGLDPMDTYVWSPSESSSDCGKLFCGSVLVEVSVDFFMIVQVTTVMKLQVILQ